MSDEEKDQTKELVGAINQLGSIVQQLSKDMEQMKSELKNVKSGSEHAELLGGNDNNAVHHSIKKIENRKIEDHLSNRQKAEELLSKAAGAAILNYKKHPPKHRR